MNSSQSQNVGGKGKTLIGIEKVDTQTKTTSPGLIPRGLVEKQQSKSGESDFTNFDNNITGNAIKSTLKIIAGVGIATVGGVGAALVLPLTLLGAGIGAVLGKHKSQKFQDFSHQEDMTTAGAIIGSLGFLCAASYGKEMIESGYGDLTHLHETEESRKSRKEYKKITKRLKSSIENKKKTIDYLKKKRIAYLNKHASQENKLDSQVAINLQKAMKSRIFEFDLLANKLQSIQEPNKQIKAIELIFKDVMRNNNILDAKQVRDHIKYEFSNLKPNTANKIDLGEGKGRCRYIVSKNPPTSSKMFEIGKISHMLGSGAFGEVFAIEYLQRAREDEKAGSMVAKLAKENDEAKQDVINEKTKLIYLNQKNLDNPTVQEAPIAIFEGGYIGKKYSGGSLEKVIENKTKMEVAEKVDFTNDVLNQLNYVHGKGIYHGDIKPANILCKKDVKGKITKLAIGDYGGAQTFDEMFVQFPTELGQILGVCSPFYISPPIMIEIGEIISNTKNSKEAQIKARAEIEELLKKNDEYATALTLYDLWTLTGENVEKLIQVFTIQKPGFIIGINLPLCKKKLKTAGMPEEMIKRMIDMLSYGWEIK